MPLKTPAPAGLSQPGAITSAASNAAPNQAQDQRAAPHAIQTADNSSLSAVWVANLADRSVLRIDPANNAIAATISINGRPDLALYAENAVWVLDKQGNQVFRIDPATNQVNATVALPSGSASSLVDANGSIWVGMTGKIEISELAPATTEEEQLPPGMVVQIDPMTGAIQEKFSVQPVSRIAVGGSALWVLSRAVIDTPLQVLDLNSKQGMAVPLQNAPEWLPIDALTVDTANLWLFSSAYGKIFHAGLDGRINSAIQLEEHQPTGYADLLLDDSGLWAATPWGTLLRVDRGTNHILSQIDLNVALTGLQSASGAIWALSQQTGTLYRIDPNSNAIAAEIKIGAALEPTVIPTSTPHVVIWQPCPDAPKSRLHVGDLAYVTKDPPLPNRVRTEPNRDADMLGYINPAGSMEILEGPSCADGWVWWKVKNADLEGWTAEGDQETYWLVPLFK